MARASERVVEDGIAALADVYARHADAGSRQPRRSAAVARDLTRATAAALETARAPLLRELASLASRIDRLAARLDTLARRLAPVARAPASRRRPPARGRR